MASPPEQALILLCHADRCEKGYLPIGIFTLEGVKDYCQKLLAAFTVNKDDGFDIYGFKLMLNQKWEPEDKDHDAVFIGGREDGPKEWKKSLNNFIKNLETQV